MSIIEVVGSTSKKLKVRVAKKSGVDDEGFSHC